MDKAQKPSNSECAVEAGTYHSRRNELEMRSRGHV
jgi:hypothetical protein